MDERIYDYWAATLQDGYLGDLVNIVDNAGGAHGLYDMTESSLRKAFGITDKLADYILEKRPDIGMLERSYDQMCAKGICYVNHADDDFPTKLLNIPSIPYGLFVKGQLPDPDKPAVAIVGARECSEYGRLMAEYLGSRLAKSGVQIISGMAWGIDGISQDAAISSGGRSYGILGCGVDVVYPAKNRPLYMRLSENGNGLISEYAPGTHAVARLFPPRNRIISGLCDVLIVVEARKRSGTLITVDMAIDQGRCVMVVPGRLTDELSAGCMKLLYQGALPVTGIDSVLEVLGVGKQMSLDDTIITDTGNASANKTAGDRMPDELNKIADLLTIDPKSVEAIATLAGMPVDVTLVMLSRLELNGIAREVWPGYFIKNVTVS